MHQDSIDIFSCLFSWSDSWHEPSSFLNIISYLFWREYDKRIEESEYDNQSEIKYNSRYSWLLSIDIKISFYPICYTNQSEIRRLELSDKFREQIGEWYESDREDNRHHTYGIHRDRQWRWFFHSSSSCIDDRYLFDRFEDKDRKEYKSKNDNKHKEGNSKDARWSWHTSIDFLDNSRYDRSEDQKWCSIWDSVLSDQFSYPHQYYWSNRHSECSSDKIYRRSANYMTPEKIIDEEYHSDRLKKC